MGVWETKPYKRVLFKGAPIEKSPEEWVWETASVGSSGQKATLGAIGKILTDDIYECGFCGGKGEKPPVSRCSICGGKGRVRVNSPAVICAYCKGGGEEKPRSNITCTVCSGKGVIHVQEPVERCRHCQGTGKEPTNKLPCIVCRGSGVVTVKKEEERLVYRKRYQEFQEPEPSSSSKSRPKSRSQPGSKFKSKKKTCGIPSGSEKEAMEIIHELGAADSAAVGRRMLLSSSYADYLCNSLIKTGLLTRDSRKYALTPAGKKLLKKKE